jgi:cytochrome c peroxidase
LEEQGEQKFYDATVSLDGWFSCHSCHTDGHTNGQRADTFGDEDRGAPKKVVSLLGTASSGPWAWNGSKSHLEEQIKTSLIISMQTQIETEDLPIEPLAAYLRTLSPPPSIHTARGNFHEHTFSPDLLAEAKREFDSAGCRNCHSGNAFTSQDSFDVGIHDEMGETSFNPPSLRGVSQRAPYFHDGRAKSLDEVLQSAHHDTEHPLTKPQIQRLTLFLESL